MATPLERQFSTIPGLTDMTSSSSLGSTNVTLQFDLSRDIDGAAQDVQSAISSTLRQLPQGISPPSIRKVEPGGLAHPVLRPHHRRHAPLRSSTSTPRPCWRSTSPRWPAWRRCRCSARRSTRCGCSSTPSLAQRGIGIDEVASAIAQGNVNLPSGVLWGTDRAYTVQASGQLHDAAAFRRAGGDVPQRRPRAPGRPGPGPRRRAEQQEHRPGTTASPAIILAIQRQPGTNTVAVAAAVRDQVAALQSQLPAGVNIAHPLRPLGLDPGLGATT